MKTIKLCGSVLVVVLGALLANGEGLTLPVEALPDGYAQLEWVGSFEGTEYVDTGYILQAGEVVDMTVEVASTQPSSYTVLFGCRTDGTPESSFVFQPNWDNPLNTNPTYKSGGNYAVSGVLDYFPVEEPVALRCTNAEATWVGTGGSGSIAIPDAHDANCVSPLMIFNQNCAMTADGVQPTDCKTKAKFYSFKILAADQTTVRRNYVPCRRKSDGAAGFYETVAGGFFPNASAVGRIYGSDEPASLRYSYVQFTSRQQYFDTGYIHTPDTTVEMVTFVPTPGSFPGDNYQALFGTHGQYGDDSRSMGFMPWSTWKSSAHAAAVYLRDSQIIGADFGQDFIYDSWLKMVFTPEGASWWKLDGSGTVRSVTSPEGTRTSGTHSLLINGFWCGSNDDNGAEGHPGEGLDNMKFRSFKISEPSGVVRELIPMRLLDRSHGLYDVLTGERYDVKSRGGSSDVTFGGVLHVVSEDGTTIQVWEGDFSAEDIIGYTAVEKKGPFALNASAVTAFPALAHCEGELSFQNGAAQEHRIAGTLKLVGGVRLVVDWVGTACDSFSAGAVDLSQASAASPITVVADVMAATLDSASPVVLFASGMSEGDEAKFVAPGAGVEFFVEESKLLMRFADATTPVQAEWTGQGTRGVMSDARNWNCYNNNGELLSDVLPMDATTVTIPENLAGSFEWLEGETLSYKKFVFPTFVSLTQDCDWRGMTMPFNGTVTLNGHKLLVNPKSLEGSGRFVDSVSGGELLVDVPQGVTLNNAGNDVKALDGTLKLVKIGPGTIGSIIAGNQTYTGGTEIRGGTLTASGWGTDHRWGAANSTITVGTNSVFELEGMVNFNDYTIVLDGGTLQNSKTSRAWGDPWHLNAVKSIRVDSNSTINFSKAYSLMNYANDQYGPTTLDLQKNTLTVNFTEEEPEYCYFSSTTATRGTLELHGRFGFIGGDFMGPETTFDLYGSISPEADIHIGTYICRTTSGTSNRDKNVYVYECFKPITDMFWGCVMKNNAVLDLSERTGVWNVKGTYNTECQTTVLFEDNATIYIELGDRVLAQGDQVVGWDDTTKPTNLSTLHFKAVSGSKYHFEKAATGVYVARGLVIVIR